MKLSPIPHAACPAVLAAGLLACGPAFAATTESAGSAVAIVLPALAAGVSLYHDDWRGLAQLSVDTVATVAIAYGLKNTVREKRPDGSDYQSFPSDTAALAFAPAQFLWDRYGWQYGVPAYAAAAFVAYSRVDARKHHWYDVTASAALALGVSKIFTTTWHPRGMTYGIAPTNGGAAAALEYRF